MKKTMVKCFWALCLSALVMACGTTSEYETLRKRELASGQRYDSLFLDISFGMDRKKFFGHCWELNKQGLVRQGSQNTSVMHRMFLGKDTVQMDFYPEFHEGKIYEMPVSYAYQSWAPWNKNMSSDTLLVFLLDKYKQEYGDGFIEITHPKKGTAYVKVNGNRRISIYRKDDMTVAALFTDLLVEEAAKKEKADQMEGRERPYSTF